jgi:NTP pyrophosphatase (non-canonical NTP hydrolase)
MQKIDLNKYAEFVAAVTSEESNSTPKMISRIQQLEEQGCNVSLLLTAALGLSAEAGEFTEVVKKILFQGKPYNDDNHFHMVRELSDCAWYLANAARALEIDPNEIFFENVRKLEARYPGGKFSAAQSETRAVGDL